MRRDVLANHAFTASDQAILNAIYTGDALAFQSRLWSDGALAPDPDFKPNPPNAVETVKTIEHADPGCIWVITTSNDTASEITPKSPIDAGLVLKFSDTHDRTLNPAPWIESEATMPSLLNAKNACG